MPDKVFGLPAHPLLVHIPVVLLPVCALAAILLAVQPRLVDRYGTAFAVLTGCAFVGTVLAARTGPELRHLLNEETASIEQHARWGDRTEILSVLFFVLAVAFVVVSKRANRARLPGGDGKRTIAVPILAASLSVVAVFTTAAVIRTGHTGAEAVWEDASVRPPNEGSVLD
jgi:uncharacterized membrane protein